MTSTLSYALVWPFPDPCIFVRLAPTVGVLELGDGHWSAGDGHWKSGTRCWVLGARRRALQQKLKW